MFVQECNVKMFLNALKKIPQRTLTCFLDIIKKLGFFTLLKQSLTPEAEKPRRRVGIADRKVFARPESFCACLKIKPQNK